MRSLLLGGVSLSVAGVVLALAQLWWKLLAANVFFKLEATIGGLLLITVVVWVARRESEAFAHQRDTKLGE